MLQLDGSGQHSTLLVSRDVGATWSEIDVTSLDPARDELSDEALVHGSSGYSGQVIVGTDRVVVLGHTNRGEPGSPERSATLTGVPRLR